VEEAGDWVVIPYRTAGNRRGTWRYGFDNDIPRQKKSQSTSSLFFSLIFFFFFGVIIITFFHGSAASWNILCILLYQSPFILRPSYRLRDWRKGKKAAPHQLNPALAKLPTRTALDAAII